MTDDTVIEARPSRGMTDDERRLAADFYTALQRHSRYDERGRQSAEYRVGISDLGFCSERTRRMLAQEDPDDTDLLPALIGTAIGAYAEEAYLLAHPRMLRQPEVSAYLYGERHTYHVPGHPDLVDPLGRIIDVKTTRGLEIPRRKGPSQQQQFQRHVYALGAFESGLFECSLDDVTVSNIWIDRAADEREVHVHTEPYSAEIVQQATWWLDEVVYAYVHQQTGRKEPPYEMCQKVCGFFNTCRLGDTDVEGLLSDESVLAAVDMYREAREMEADARRLKDQARAALDGITGSTGEYVIRWTHVGGAEVEYYREPYERLDIRRVK